jgi:hypothetical protein
VLKTLVSIGFGFCYYDNPVDDAVVAHGVDRLRGKTLAEALEEMRTVGIDCEVSTSSECLEEERRG